MIRPDVDAVFAVAIIAIPIIRCIVLSRFVPRLAHQLSCIDSRYVYRLEIILFVVGFPPLELDVLALNQVAVYFDASLDGAVVDK